MANSIAHGRDGEDDDEDGVAQHGGHTSNNRLTGTCRLGLPCPSLILDIHVKTNWHLSKQGIHWPASRDHIVGSSLELIEATCFLEVYRWPSAVFFFLIGSWALVRLTCWKQGQVVWKLVNANPGLEVNRFHCFCFVLKLETECQYTENLTEKLKNSNQNFRLSWVSSIARPSRSAFRLD